LQLYCIINAQYNYYISNNGLLEECDKEENVEVTGAATASCVKFLSNVTYSPSHRQAGTPIINTQSTLRTAPDLCKNVSLAVLFGSNGNSYTTSKQSDMCIHTHILHNIGTLVGQKK
jgi:hypothetical protein